MNEIFHGWSKKWFQNSIRNKLIPKIILTSKYLQKIHLSVIKCILCFTCFFNREHCVWDNYLPIFWTKRLRGKESRKDSARTRCGSCCWLRVPQRHEPRIVDERKLWRNQKSFTCRKKEEIKRYPRETGRNCTWEIALSAVFTPRTHLDTNKSVKSWC